MKNIGLGRIKYLNVDNFTTATGLKLRRIINKPLRFILKKTFLGKIIIDNYPKLNKNESYIFVSTHTCVDEIHALLATIDRSAYTLIGTSEQLEYNPKVYANWLTGLIYVDRYDETSRKESLPKMQKVIESGSSILLFPEGGWNNTENLPVMKLFPGFYKLARLTGAKVVSISVFQEYSSKNIYINVSEPIDVNNMDRYSACDTVRDIMATMMFEQIEKYSSPLKRSELSGDIHLNYMDERKNEYLKTVWTKDVWDDELTMYKGKDITPQDIRKSLDNVNINQNNAYIMAPILVQREQDEKYDFKSYMKNNWNR